MDTLLNLLIYLGITPQQLVPLVLVVGIFALVFWNYLLKDLKEEVTDLHNATKEIQHILQTDNGKSFVHELNQKPLYASYGKSNSPSVPNDKGEALLKNSKFYDQYSLIKDKLFILMDTMNLRTLYDYELGSIKALEQLEASPEFDPLKDYAVNHPEEPLELIFKVASWVIRDDYSKYRQSSQKSA